MGKRTGEKNHIVPYHLFLKKYVSFSQDVHTQRELRNSLGVLPRTIA